jgi:hypothetical protein
VTTREVNAERADHLAYGHCPCNCASVRNLLVSGDAPNLRN